MSALRAEGRLAEGFAEDAARALSLSRALLCLPPQPQGGSPDERPPRQLLALALSARASLDDLRRDLATLQPGGLQRGALKAIGGWLLDLIPNPLSFIKPWVSWLVLGFRVRSSRAELVELDRRLGAGGSGISAGGGSSVDVHRRNPGRGGRGAGAT